MKKILILATMALSSLSAFAGGTVTTDSLTSSILKSEVKFNVYLPEGYDKSTHYPVIYLLHGLSDDYTAWMVRGNMSIVADELIASGECLPAVIIMPNAGGHDTANIWNGYFNMPGWNYEDFFFSEFIPTVERRYNAGGSKGMRAVMGLSMGGGGSTVYCQHHPDMFSTCYAKSAWLDNEGDLVGHGESRNKRWYVCKAVRDNSAVEFVRNADEGTIVALRTVKWFFDCGDDDFLLDFTLEIHKLMRERKIKDELRVRNGTHNWEYWHTALRTALPFASRNFDR